MKYYYANAQNQPTGPVSIEDLQGLLASGILNPSSNVIPENGQQWIPLSTVLPAPVAAPPVTPATTATAQNGNLFTNWSDLLADIVGNLLEKCRAMASESFLTRIFRGAITAGQLLIIAGAVLGFLSCLIEAFKPNQLVTLFVGIAGVFVIAILQYVSKRFFQGCSQLIANSPSSMASAAVLDCIALVSIVAAILVLLGGLYASISIHYGQMPIFLSCCAASLALFLLGAIALNPKVANISIAPSSAGEEAMGIMSFFIKLPLIFTPIFFFVLTLSGFVVCAVSLFHQGAQGQSYPLGEFSMILMFVLSAFTSLAPGASGIAILAGASLLPLLMYIEFLIAYLMVDIVRAIVCIPGKLDALRNK